RQELADTGRAYLFTSFDEYFCIEPKRSTLLQNRPHRLDCNQMLPFVVGRTASINAVAFDRDLPGVETGTPLVADTLYDISMAINQNGRLRGVFHPRGKQHWACAAVRIIQHLGFETETVQDRANQITAIAVKLRQPSGNLTLGGYSHQLPQQLKITTVVKSLVSAVDGRRSIATHCHPAIIARAFEARLSSPRQPKV